MRINHPKSANQSIIIILIFKIYGYIPFIVELYYKESILVLKSFKSIQAPEI